MVYVYADGRGGKHVAKHLERFSGIVQVDAYAGYNILEKPNRPAGPIKLAFCWTHLRSRFYEFYKSTGSPIANEAMERIGRFYAIEKKIRGFPDKNRQIPACSRIAAKVGPVMPDLRSFAPPDRDRPRSRKSPHHRSSKPAVSTMSSRSLISRMFSSAMVSGKEKANQIDQIMPWNWQKDG